MPQLFAWNIGVTGITTSVPRSPQKSPRLATSVCRMVERCE
jgi:hypothetical protein